MARGFLAGAIMGTVVSVVGAGTLSVLMGPPEAPQMTPPEPAPAIDTDTDTDTGTGADTTAGAETDAAPAVDTAPVTAEEPAEVQPPEPLASEPVAGTAQTEAPETGSAPAAPQPAPEDAAPEPAATDPGTAPEAETELETPVAPDAPAENTALAPSAAESPARTVPGTPAPEAPSAEPSPELATESAELPEPVEETPAPEPNLPAALAPELEEQPAPEPAPDVAGLPDTADEDASTGPAIGTPGSSLIDRDGAVPTSRLPSVGASSEPAADTATSADTGSVPPLERYAADAVAADGEPLMSIVLIDDGRGPMGPDTVGEFPFPVSFAIAPSHPDAAATAAAYRARGFEVLALAGAPQGAQASDVEVALEGALDAVPEAVAVLENPDMGLQESRAVSEQAAEFLNASGHGLVMLPKGLNTGQALAQRLGVPAVTVFRDFDGEGQDPRVMRRFLDQAAFKARQEGAVVMLGRLRADTVSALLLWGLQDRATSIALVPVSVVLREATDEG